MAKRNLTESELKQELDVLKEELAMQDNKKVLEVLFEKFGEDLRTFQKKHFSQIKRLIYVRNRIWDIELELMTPEEREREKAHIKNVMDRWQCEADANLPPEKISE